MWYTHTMDYYLATKRNKVHETTWKEPWKHDKRKEDTQKNYIAPSPLTRQASGYESPWLLALPHLHTLPPSHQAQPPSRIRSWDLPRPVQDHGTPTSRTQASCWACPTLLWPIFSISSSSPSFQPHRVTPGLIKLFNSISSHCLKT